MLLACGPTLWHQRLEHLGPCVLRFLFLKFIACDKDSTYVTFNWFRLSKHVRLPFTSFLAVYNAFNIIHNDIWTSPIQIISGIIYYVLFLGHYSHFFWIYPLCNKSEVITKFLHFCAYVKTQLNTEIKSLQ